MQFSKEDLTNLSLLSRITIPKEAEDKMLADMQAILGYVSEINDVQGEVAGREFTAKMSGHYNIVREDVVTHTASSNTEVILREAPETEDGYVKVAQVLK
jgi:aspartyl-tRNA(Asn)/glutamyl-tRNA(Gln) amidotransferase subunit C